MLVYVTQRRGFLEAEETWRNSQDTSELKYRMSENLLVQNEMIEGMAAFNGSSIFLSTNTEHVFHLINNLGTETLQYCMDEEGDMYLAFICKSEGNLKYAALMSVEKFYHQVVGDNLFETDKILLIDRNCGVVITHQNGNIVLQKIDELEKCPQDYEILLKQQTGQREAVISYEYIEDNEVANSTARILAIPTSKTNNHEFAIGIVSDFDKAMKPLRISVTRVMVYSGMVIMGILLLLGNVIRFKRRDEKNLKELELLHEKNEMLTEVNRKTREFAHHQRLETIGTLTAGIAHEFNNLLTPIMGYSMMALEQLPAEMEDIYDNILEIYQASRKAKDITSRLSELSRKNTQTTFGMGE